MTEKCTKYEALFVFASEEDLQEHLKICPDCQSEHEQMNKISGLVKEVKPFISKKSSNKIFLKAVAGFTILFLSFMVIQVNQPNIQLSQLTQEDRKSVV